MNEKAVPPFNAALQHGPRPLPLFLELLRKETKADAARRKAALAGLKAYQTADRAPPRTLPPELHRIGRAALLDYGGAGTPVLFIPSLINPPFILDLAPERSLLRWLAARGYRVLLLDWGTPSAAERSCDIGGHVTDLLVPLGKALADSAGTPPVLVGYCLGGTMAAAAACLMPTAGLAMIASPWRFSGYGDGARARIAALWQNADPLCAALGLVPMEVLQSAFWSLDPARTIAKFEAFAAMAPGSDTAATFVALEDWANGGAPLSYAAGRQLFDFFASDAPGSGAWQVGGQAIVPAELGVPAIDFVSTTDRIAPHASAIGFADRCELRAGHVGMVVGSTAPDQLWTMLADWIRAVAGSR